MKECKGKWLTFFLAMIMILSVVVFPLRATAQDKVAEFKDVSASAWYYDYVRCLAERGVVKGYGDTGKFRPMNQVTREHAAKMVALAAELHHKGKKADFPDVDGQGEYSPYIAALVDKGAVIGFPDGSFRPPDPIRRGHAAKMVQLAFGLKASTMEVLIRDYPAHDLVVAGAIQILASNGIVKGYGDGQSFKPDDEINRAEFSKILCIASAAKAVQDAEENPNPATINHAQAQINDLPSDQDRETKDFLQARLDALREAPAIQTYQVTFKDYDGRVLASQRVKEGGKATAPSNNPKREGHTFTGWDKDFSKVTKDLTVTAQYKINAYTLTFNTDGGNAIDPMTQNYGTPINAPENPTKEGHTFDGWDKPIPATMPGENLTISAQWSANTFKVTFDPNGGGVTGDMPGQSFTYDQAQSLQKNAFVRTGHSFKGWALSAEGEVVYPDEARVKNLTAEKDGQVTLYAVWEAHKYLVTFDANGGETPSPETQEVTYDSTYGPLANSVKADYTLVGWFTEKSGGDQIKPDDEVRITSDQTLYAHWELSDEAKLLRDLATLLSPETGFLGNKDNLPSQPDPAISRELAATYGKYETAFAWGTIYTPSGTAAATGGGNTGNFTLSFQTGKGNDIPRTSYISVTLTNGTAKRVVLFEIKTERYSTGGSNPPTRYRWSICEVTDESEVIKVILAADMVGNGSQTGTAPTVEKSLLQSVNEMAISWEDVQTQSGKTPAVTKRGSTLTLNFPNTDITQTSTIKATFGDKGEVVFSITTGRATTVSTGPTTTTYSWSIIVD